MISTDKDTAPSGPSVTDSRRELLDRVVASPLFAKSERISSLLVYVCEIALTGRESEISEQTIGAALFGRSPDYDSSIDGIVRTQASRLRHKLDQYFEGEGAVEPVRIVVPKGGYVPFFVPRPPEQISLPTLTTPPHIPLPIPDETETPRSGSSRFAWGLVATLAIVIVALVLHSRGAFSKQSKGTVPNPLWSQMFAPDKGTFMISGDSGLVMWHGITNRNLGLNEYLNGSYRMKSPTASTTSEEVADYGNRRYTSFVDLEIGNGLARIAEKTQGQLQVRYARDLRPNDLKQGNFILVGATEANPWVELFESHMNFVFLNDRASKTMTVLNRAPIGSEPAQWDSKYTDAQHRVYGVVAYLPNLSGNGNAMILEGTSMAGTESAWDFVSDDSQLLPFLKHIRRADGSLPHFEVVLGTNNMNNSAVRGSILAWRKIE